MNGMNGCHVTVLGAHILDVLGRPVQDIPPGQGSVRLTEIRATAAGTPASSAPMISTISSGAATSIAAVLGLRRSVRRASR